MNHTGNALFLNNVHWCIITCQLQPEIELTQTSSLQVCEDTSAANLVFVFGDSDLAFMQ